MVRKRKKAGRSPQASARNGRLSGDRAWTGGDQYKVLAEALPDMIFICDPNGTVIYANSIAASRFGLTAAQMAGKRQMDLFPPSVARQHVQAIQQVCRTGLPLVTETPDRLFETRAWVDTRIIPIHDISENVTAVLGISRDVTARRAMEEALRGSEANFRALAENAQSGIAIFNRDGRVAFANQRALRIAGCRREEVDGVQFRRFLRPDDRKQFLDRYRKRIAGCKISSRYEATILDKKGLPLIVDITAARTLWQGHPATIVIFDDITRRKKIEGQLKFRLRFENLIMQISQRLLGAGPDDLDRVILSALRDMAKFTGVDRATIFMFSDDLKTVSATHEWSIPGLSLTRKIVRNIPLSSLPFIAVPVLRGKIVQTGEIPASAGNERQICERLSVRSFLLVPMVCRKRVIGSLSFACRESGHEWDGDSIKLVKLVGQMMAGTLYRRYLEEGHRRLADALLELQEVERNRISAMLHDHLGQILTVAKIHLANAAARKGRVEVSLQQCVEKLDGALAVVRNLASKLRPPILQDMGIGMALKTLCDEFAIEGGLKTCFVRSGPDPVLAEAISTCLYRILQEALTNIVKHARANAIHVVMRTTPQSVSLEVKDNGRGFDIHALRRGKGIGLIGMEERLLRCGGELRITSAKGRGTCLLARVPRAAK